MRRQIFIPFFLICLICLPLTAFFVGCGGGGGGGSSASSDSGDLGTFSLNVTDAKPVLPENTESVLVTFEEVHVHKAGEGWDYPALGPGTVHDRPAQVPTRQNDGACSTG